MPRNIPSQPSARSTVPTPAASMSASRTAAWRRSTGRRSNPVTDGYICAKVRRYPRTRLRARSPAPSGVRKGAKGLAQFRARVVGRGAAAHRRSHARHRGAVGRRVDPSLLVRRIERTADAGHQRRHALPPPGRLAARAHGVRGGNRRGQRCACTERWRRSPTWTSATPRLIVVWGANPSASGIHLVPHIREAQRRGAKLIVVDPRTTQLARHADIHLPIRPGTDLPVALAIHRHLFETGGADSEFLSTHTRGADRLRAKARDVDVRARSRRGGRRRAADRGGRGALRVHESRP